MSEVTINSPQDAVSSLISKMPNGLPKEVYLIDNWKISKQALGENPRKAVLHVTARCTFPGYENLDPHEWFANETDIRDYGMGDEDFWVEYVRRSFAQGLVARYMRQLRDMTNMMGAHQASAAFLRR